AQGARSAHRKRRARPRAPGGSDGRARRARGRKRRPGDQGMTAKVIGIDLGTTNSCVAIVEDGTPVVIPNRGGYKTTPSMVAIAENGKRLVGHIAKRQAITNAENTVYAAKRLIGRKWGSAAVRSSVETMPYRIVEGPHSDVRIMLREQIFSIPEMAAYILQEMK